MKKYLYRIGITLVALAILLISCGMYSSYGENRFNSARADCRLRAMELKIDDTEWLDYNGDCMQSKGYSYNITKNGCAKYSTSLSDYNCYD